MHYTLGPLIIYSCSCSACATSQHTLTNLRTLSISRPTSLSMTPPPPEYSFVGNSLISLAPLSRRLSTVPIFCRYPAEAIGSCRVDIKFVNLMLSDKHSNRSTLSTRIFKISSSLGSLWYYILSLYHVFEFSVTFYAYESRFRRLLQSFRALWRTVKLKSKTLDGFETRAR